ncbi:MAG: hypothetical protein NTW66_01870 [Candidatus Magasanikbacteria bacterium]|nr:hypothetical protein [Candidatus Magasanikbacteria bacterium]
MKFLIKIDRIAAWILFIGLILYFISGYGMAKGIIDPVMAAKIHMQYLTYIILVAFALHTGFAIHLAFRRWQIWNAGTKIVLILFYLFFLIFFIWVDRFYTVNFNSTKSDVPAVQKEVIQNNQNSLPVTSEQASQKAFTMADLALFNGQNGQPSYVAVDGLVYDLSAVFRGGWHAAHFAGKDLTNEFYSKHAKNILSKYPPVGRLVK